MIKNYFQLLFLLLFSFAFSQESNIGEECATEKIMKDFYVQHPENSCNCTSRFRKLSNNYQKNTIITKF